MGIRFFNTAGPCDPQYHYRVPAAERLPDAPQLIDQGGYFVVHAPRQTGKTTSLIALAKEITRRGEYAALYFSCEVGRSLGEDLVAVQRAILRTIAQEAELALAPELRPPSPWPAHDDALLLSDGLRAWSGQCPRRLVLIFDEIDAVHGRSLLNVLSQLRANYRLRPGAAPWSVILCGLRDVRDYKAKSGGDPSRLGSSSPFNIKVESMRLGDFTADEVSALYAQHTADTGQEFTVEAVARAFEATRGQPWLVNALARVNGGGFIDREYGLGRGRMDLLIRWPYHDEQGRKKWQREAVEIKVWQDKKADPRERGLAQLDGYLDQLGLDHNVLVVFDRRTDAPPHAERITMSQDVTPAGRPALLLRA